MARSRHPDRVGECLLSGDWLKPRASCFHTSRSSTRVNLPISVVISEHRGHARTSVLTGDLKNLTGDFVFLAPKILTWPGNLPAITIQEEK